MLGDTHTHNKPGRRARSHKGERESILWAVASCLLVATQPNTTRRTQVSQHCSPSASASAALQSLASTDRNLYYTIDILGCCLH